MVHTETDIRHWTEGPGTETETETVHEQPVIGLGSDSGTGYPAVFGRRKQGMADREEKWGQKEAAAEAVLTWQMTWSGESSTWQFPGLAQEMRHDVCNF